VPIRDDEQFERYLRQFKPVAAGPLPAARRRSALVRSWLYFVPAAAAVAVLLVLMFTPRGRSKPVIAPQAENSAGAQELATAQPLTLQQANELLTHAPSFSAALDNVAFQRQRRKLPQGSLSALAALSKEDIKL
jgi:hypothetical protein